MSPRLDVRLDRDRYGPGDTVRGWITVAEGGASRDLSAALEYREETEDYEEVAERIETGPLHVGDLTTGASFEFQLKLPDDARPGYKSTHGELYWELDVKSDERGRDTHERRRVEVVIPRDGE